MLQGVEGTVRRRTSQEAAHAGRAPVVGRACVRFASGLEQQLFRRWCLDALHAAGPIHGAATVGGGTFGKVFLASASNASGRVAVKATVL